MAAAGRDTAAGSPPPHDGRCRFRSMTCPTSRAPRPALSATAETCSCFPSRCATRSAATLSSARRRQFLRSCSTRCEALATQISLAVEGASLAEDLHRRQSEARFRSLVAHSSDLITVLDAHGVVTYQSPSIERVLGYGVDEIEGTRFDRLLRDGRSSPAGAGRARAIGPGGGIEAHAIDCSLRHRDGTWLQFEVQHTDLLADEHVRGIVLNSRDVSERKAFEDQLAHQAFHDPVTNLANRPLFSDRVQHALTRAERIKGRRRRALHRPGRVQDRQRQPRPCSRRPRAPRGGADG